MVRTLLVLLLAAVLLAPATLARQSATGQEAMVTVEVRVTSSDPGFAWVDRGSADGLAKGDRVVLVPRDGRTLPGTLADVTERGARVELQDPTFRAEPGTRGEVRVPRARIQSRPTPRARPRQAPQPDEPTERPPVDWQRPADDWRDGEPLLAKVRPLRPAERPERRSGRWYASLDWIDSSEDDRTDAYVRGGGSVLFENTFGRGERFQADAEWNWRDVDVPDQDGENRGRLRVDRLSWSEGGTRFAPVRWEVGRFLQGGMPELGVLDGAAWDFRRPDGTRWGVSVGFMPEPDPDFESGHDFQVAGWWRWVLDEAEQMSFATAYQKTFHDGNADRDLLIASFRRLPRVGWTVLGSLWIDLYTGGDDRASGAIGVTQAYLSGGRRWENGGSLDLVYTHLEFPDVDRDEFTPVLDAQVGDDHAERLALRGVLPLTAEADLRTTVGGFCDEDESGGDAEVILSMQEFLFDHAFCDVGAFGVSGRFSNTIGTRLTLGCYQDDGRFAVDYFFEQNRLDGFTAANDDLPQHRLRIGRDWHTRSGWDLSARLEGLFYDQETAVLVSLFLQRSY